MMQIPVKQLGHTIKPRHIYTASHSISLVVLSDGNQANARTHMSWGLKWWIRAHRARPDLQDWVRSFTSTFL